MKPRWAVAGTTYTCTCTYSFRYTAEGKWIPVPQGRERPMDWEVLKARYPVCAASLIMQVKADRE